MQLRRSCTVECNSLWQFREKQESCSRTSSPLLRPARRLRYVNHQQRDQGLLTPCAEPEERGRRICRNLLHARRESGGLTCCFRTQRDETLPPRPCPSRTTFIPTT